MENRKQSPPTLPFLVVSIYCLSMLPRLLSYGMFFDGVTFASIARNLADGYGSFWHLYYTDFVYPEFFEHPPLVFFLQSLAFRTFGDSTSVEAFWGFAVGLILIYLIGFIWRLEKGIDEKYRSGGWVPELLFITLPMTSWLLSNNLLDGTMTLLTTLASLCAIQSLTAHKRIKYFIMSVLSGIMILGAVLAKGPVGLFPLAIPFIWFIVYDRKNWIRPALVTILMFAGIITVSLILAILNSDSVLFMNKYISQQVIASVSGERESGSRHFWIMYVVLREVVVPVLIVLTIWGVLKVRKIGVTTLRFNNTFLFYFLVALSASVPIMLTPKQLMWYVFPSLPFYTLAVAALFNDQFKYLEDKLSLLKNGRPVVFVIASLILAGSVIWMFKENGMVRKQIEFHSDFSVQTIEIPQRQIISVYPAGLKYDWGLLANIQRKFKASLSDSIGYKYLLTTIDQKGFIDSIGVYKQIHPLNPARYVLYIHR